MTKTPPSINDRNARTASAAAVFQKGMYHLFMLRRGGDLDIYATTLRTYQALFQLCLSQYLLDYRETISNPRVNLAHCADAKNPTAAEVDPAVAVKHFQFAGGSGGWKGHPEGSPLGESSLLALSLISRTTEARHNLIYRPQLLMGGNLHWEDGPIQELIAKIPTPAEVLDAYRKFIDAMLNQQASEIERDKKLRQDMGDQPNKVLELLANSEPSWAGHFVQQNFWPYKDKKNERPTETILSTYARMMNPTRLSFVDELREFRNTLFDLGNIKERFHFQPDWCLGEL